MRPKINRFIHTSYKVKHHLDRNARLLPVSAYAKPTQSSQPSYERSALQTTVSSGSSQDESLRLADPQKYGIQLSLSIKMVRKAGSLESTIGSWTSGQDPLRETMGVYEIVFA